MTKKESLKKYNNFETKEDLKRSLDDLFEEFKERYDRRMETLTATLLRQSDEKLRQRYPSFF